MATILGIPFSEKNMAQTLTALNHHLDQKSFPFHVVTANPEVVMQAKRNRRFRMVVKQADMVTPDGIGIVIGSRILKENVPERVTGYDLIMNLLSLREEQQKKTRVFLLGAKEDVIPLAAEQLSSQYPHIDVVGYHHGYFEEESTEEDKIVKTIKESNSDLVLVGFGCPRQEMFISQYKEAIGAKLYIGCGGSLDVVAGEVKRAPEFIQKVYLEWAWRLVKQPSRWKRQLDIPRFLVEVVREKRKKQG
ncbi:hypothetical protein CN918_25720 [Priestia megaterium]|nr:hypothetical protein CN918_25720 [Priestia megaterium]